MGVPRQRKSRHFDRCTASTALEGVPVILSAGANSKTSSYGTTQHHDCGALSRTQAASEESRKEEEGNAQTDQQQLPLRPPTFTALYLPQWFHSVYCHTGTGEAFLCNALTGAKSAAESANAMHCEERPFHRSDPFSRTRPNAERFWKTSRRVKSKLSETNVQRKSHLLLNV